MIPKAPWATLDLSLTSVPELIERPADCRAVLVLLWYHGAYMGRLKLSADEFPLRRREALRLAAQAIGPGLRAAVASDGDYANAIRLPHDPGFSEAARQLGTDGLLKRVADAIEKRTSRRTDLTASIAICTAHRPDALKDCLHALDAEIRAGRDIVVVDNAPSPKTEAVVAAFDGVRYVAEPKPGLSTARNTAIAETTGDILVLVDDDVRPEPGWIDRLLAGFETDRVAVVCGLVLPLELQTDAQVVFENGFGFGGMAAVPLRFDDAFRISSRSAVPVWDIGAGANMAIRRSTAIKLGGFDERIGPGAAGGCGDDSEYWYRALSAGYEARYEPLSVVRHQHRAELPAVRHQARGYFKGHLIALLVQFAHDRDWRNLRRVFFGLPYWIIRRILSRFIWRHTGKDMFHSVVLIGDMLLGYLSGLAYIHWALVSPPTKDRATRTDRP